MITKTASIRQIPSWQKALSEAVTDLDELYRLLGLTPPANRADAATRQFSLKVPRSYIARMETGQAQDPLLLQVLPQAIEAYPVPGYSADPVAEQHAMALPGLLHKYHGRVLLVTTPACAIHCRYCFRRHFPYSDARLDSRTLKPILNYLAEHSEIKEVILSGGDPLSMSDQRLGLLVKQLQDIPHLTTLRIHTRLPVVLPERIDDNLLSWLAETRLKLVMVIHCNHPNEIDDQVQRALLQLHQQQVNLFNQTVLLRGINDNAETLVRLSEKLFQSHVIPYYLHALDKVAGAAHFDMTQAAMTALYAELRSRLPGYLLPRLVREEAGEAFKTPL